MEIKTAFHVGRPLLIVTFLGEEEFAGVQGT